METTKTARLLNDTQNGVRIVVNSDVDYLPLKTKKYFVFEAQQVGRVLIANRDFKVGDVVLCEAPLITFSNTEDMISKYALEMTMEQKLIC